MHNKSVKYVWKITNMQKKFDENSKLFESIKYKSRTHRIKCMYATPRTSKP